jgi:hypothetical protein
VQIAMFAKLSTVFNDQVAKVSSSTQDKAHHVFVKAQEAADKFELRLYNLMELAKLKYKQRNLDGSVNISLTVGSFTSSVDSEIVSTPINAEDKIIIDEGNDVEESELDMTTKAVDETEEENRLMKIAKATMNKILDNMEMRSKTWTMNNSNSSTLTGCISLTVPCIGLLGMSISFTASVNTLFAQLKQRELSLLEAVH